MTEHDCSKTDSEVTQVMLEIKWFILLPRKSQVSSPSQVTINLLASSSQVASHSTSKLNVKSPSLVGGGRRQLYVTDAVI